LGELPHGWIRTRLGEIAEVILGQSPPSSSYNEDRKGLPFYQGKLEFGRLHPTPRKWCTASKKIAQEGDVLISVRAPVGPTNVCPAESCIGRGLAAIRGLGGIGTLFILYLLRAFENEIARKGTGTTFSAIGGDQLKKLEVPLPPLNEQVRIVAKLEELFARLDAGVEGLRKVKAQLKCYRQAVLKYAFEGKLTEEWRKTHEEQIEPASKLLERIKQERKEKLGTKYKELPPIDASEPPKLPESWLSIRLGEISERMQYGTSEKASPKPSGIPVLRMGNIQEGKIVFDGLKYFHEDWSQLNEFLLNDGDVLFNRTNSAELVGKTAVYREHLPKAVFASYLIRVQTDKTVYIPEILSFFINSFYGRRYISSVVSQQVGQANVNGTKLSLMPIPLMQHQEQIVIQQEIERCFSIADEMEEATKQSLKQAELLRQSILKVAFEGKLVPQDPDDEPADKLLERIKEERAISKGEHGKNENKPRQLELSNYVK